MVKLSFKIHWSAASDKAMMSDVDLLSIVEYLQMNGRQGGQVMAFQFRLLFV